MAKTAPTAQPMAFRWLANAPLVILLASASIVISSYLLAGWLMRPVGDDYSSLSAYHIGVNWLHLLPHTIATGGGRYGQTIVGVAWYGALGVRGLMLTAMISLGLFLAAGYLAVLAWQKKCKLAYNHKIALTLPAILFLLYTVLSVTFPWVRGHIDNSFQDFLWLPGFLTYTLPIELLVCLLAGVVLLRERLSLRVHWLVITGLAGIFLGTFTELTSLLYAEGAGLIGLYFLVKHRFAKHALKQLVTVYLPFVTIGAGLLAGLVLNLVSAATATRRADFNEQATVGQLLSHSLQSTHQYLSTYVYGQAAPDHLGLSFVLLAGIVGGLTVLSSGKITASWRLAKTMVWSCVFAGIMTVSAIFICFFSVFKGYGITPYSYLVPRFEIAYNLWLCILVAGIGVLLAVIGRLWFDKKHWISFTPALYAVLSLCLLLLLPHILQQTAKRFQVVAVFSSNWTQQNDQLQYASATHTATVSVPVIDIGDSYNIHCAPSSGDDWLGLAKQQFYRLPKICATD